MARNNDNTRLNNAFKPLSTKIKAGGAWPLPQNSVNYAA